MALILLKDSKARAREPPGKPLIEPKELFLNIKKVIQPTARNITGLIEPGTLAIRKYPLKARKKRIDSSGSIKNAEIPNKRYLLERIRERNSKKDKALITLSSDDRSLNIMQ